MIIRAIYDEVLFRVAMNLVNGRIWQLSQLSNAQLSITVWETCILDSSLKVSMLAMLSALLRIMATGTIYCVPVLLLVYELLHDKNKQNDSCAQSDLSLLFA